MAGEELLDKAMKLLRRYHDETPLGHQPHMIAHQATEILEAYDAHRQRAGEEIVYLKRDVAGLWKVDHLTPGEYPDSIPFRRISAAEAER